ncbi:MAG: DUF6677 family protein [Acidobacteriota bacterium]
MAKSKQKAPGATTADPQPLANPHVAAGLAWLFPGLGHWYVGRRNVAFAFAALVIGSLVIGWQLDGRLLWEFGGSPIPILGTLGTLGSGLPLLAIRLGLDYTGDPTSAGWEYGGAFILTAGLMNLLLVLDAWDTALGRGPQVIETGRDDHSDAAEEEEA